MNKVFTLLFLCLAVFFAKAQTPSATQPYGKIDIADLELKSCDFEKDANAMILFEKGSVYFDTQYNIINNIHKRIKIFNDNGKKEANIRIEFNGGDRSEMIFGLQAQTINLNNGAIEIVKVDKKQIFTEVIDRSRSAMVFSFPNIKPGSVIEYKYSLKSDNISNFPDWYFQSHLPNRYSELKTTIPGILYYKNLETINQPYAVREDKNGDQTRAIANIPSVPDEPYMTSIEDNSERILFQLMSIQNGMQNMSFSDTWKKVGEDLMRNDAFGSQLNRRLSGEDVIINKAKALKTTDDKIFYLFGEVKNAMKWSESYRKYSYDGISSAWDKKVGNSGEINIILYHLLKKSGVKVYPMIVSTRSNGRVNPAYPNSYKFNSTVAYVPVDSTKSYVLDASNKYNIYNQVPANLLNTLGLYINKENDVYEMTFLQNTHPVKQYLMINGEIKADSKMTGTVDITNFDYKKSTAIEKYKTAGEKKYTDYLRNDDNNLKISSLKFENMDVDTLPLKQSINFNLDLTSSDNNYIYFNPILLSSFKSNPFLSTNRFTDIDFGYLNNYYIIGTYSIPEGYKVDALPKSVSMVMPDKSISFKRVTGEQDGKVMVRYTIDYQKSMYFKENYPEFHEFCKKMYEMLNEQIVLKKS
jgi:hypothetical protein